MSRTHSTMLGLVLVAFALTGCDEKPATTEAPAGTAAPAPAAMNDEQVDAADIPVIEDFEDEAAEQINADNVDDEVAKLEAEIGSGE